MYCIVALLLLLHEAGSSSTSTHKKGRRIPVRELSSSMTDRAFAVDGSSIGHRMASEMSNFASSNLTPSDDFSAFTHKLKLKSDSLEDSSFNPVVVMESEYPLCRHFDDRLAHKSGGQYMPAITWSSALGGRKHCNRHHFRLEDQVGKGTFGKVLRARHEPTGKSVALKWIKYEPVGMDGQQDDERYEKMAQMRMEECLQHRMEDFKPVARHYCTFETGSRRRKDGQRHVVLVLELIDGPDLFDVIYEHAMPYGPDEILCWTSQLILTLRHLHMRSIVLLDVKAENVMIERATGNIRLVDFGLAGDPARPSQWMEGKHLGTPMYTPPEHISFGHGPGRFGLDDGLTEDKAFIGDVEDEFTTAGEEDEDDGFEIAKESWESESSPSSDLAPFSDWHSPAADWWALGVLLAELLLRHPPVPTHRSEEFMYAQIKRHGVVLPAARDEQEWRGLEVVRQLCRMDPRRRLGVRRGTDAFLKEHPFFRGMRLSAFQLLYRRV